MNGAFNFLDFKRDHVLPSPRGVGLAVMRLCQRERVAMDELARLIRSDPVLTGQIIRFGNLVNPNPNRRFAAVSVDLLILIGVSVVRQISMGMSMIGEYRVGPCAGFDYERFWVRSLGQACAAQVIGLNLRVAPPTELFSCGLLADIGRLGLATANPELYSEILQRETQERDAVLADIERSLFGIDHNALSAAMMEDWQMPGLFSDAVRFHALPDESGFAPISRQQRLTEVFALAAALADYGLSEPEQRESTWQRVNGLAMRLELTPDALLTQLLQEWPQWLGLITLPLKYLRDDIRPTQTVVQSPL